MGTINIKMTSGMDCPGGQWTSISVDGVYKGRVYDDCDTSLGKAIQIILDDYPLDTEVICNSTQALIELDQLRHKELEYDMYCEEGHYKSDEFRPMTYDQYMSSASNVVSTPNDEDDLPF
jgi:hypothetical protein